MVEEENDKQVFITLPNNISIENSQLRRAWIIAILALSIGLIIALLTLCFGIFGLNVENLTISSYQGGFIGSTLGEICLHAFGLFIVYHRVGIGLEILAWTEIIRMCWLAIEVLAIMMIWIVSAIASQSSEDGNIISIYASMIFSSLSVAVIVGFILLSLADVLITVVIIIISLKLARLIEIKTRSSTEEIELSPKSIS